MTTLLTQALMWIRTRRLLQPMQGDAAQVAVRLHHSGRCTQTEGAMAEAHERARRIAATLPPLHP